jgi:hypothetical protein
MMSDFTYVARSHDSIDDADGTYDVIPIPRWALVKDVRVEVVTAGTGGIPNSTITVGFKGNGETADPDAFIDSTLGDTTAAGMIRATDDAQPGSKGKWFDDGSGMLTVTLAKGTTTTGPTFRVFVEYAIIH